MKKTPKLVVLSLSLLGYSGLSSASQFDEYIDGSIALMQQQGEIVQSAKCFGTSEAKVEKGLRSVMIGCLNRLSPENEDLIDACISEQISQRFNVADDQLDQCGVGSDTEQMASFKRRNEKMQDILDQEDANGLTDDQLAQIRALQAEQKVEGLALISQMKEERSLQSTRKSDNNYE